MMPSFSLRKWEDVRVLDLDEIEDAHRSVGGSGRGRRSATQQINHAYSMLLSSQFQGFCRDLHTECVNEVVAVIEPVSVRPVMRDGLVLNRKLDHGNPNAGNIGADFGRLGLDLWNEVKAADRRT